MEAKEFIKENMGAPISLSDLAARVLSDDVEDSCLQAGAVAFVTAEEEFEEVLDSMGYEFG